MTELITSVFNQKVYPGAGDYDDCWVVSSIQVMHAVWPTVPLPSIPTFRRWAGDPDDGKTDGGSIDEIEQGFAKGWPTLRRQVFRAIPWADFAWLLRAGPYPATVAINCSSLPADLRYGFTGLHQVSIYWNGTKWRIANPLQPNGSAPRDISETELRQALNGYSTRGVFGVVASKEAFVAYGSYDPDNASLGQVTVTVAGHAMWNPASGAYVQITALPFVRGVRGSGVASASQLVPAPLRGHPIWIVESGGTVMWLRKADAGALVPVPPPEAVDTTPFDQADLDAKAAQAAKAARGVALEEARDAAIKGAGAAVDALPR